MLFLIANSSSYGAKPTTIVCVMEGKASDWVKGGSSYLKMQSTIKFTPEVVLDVNNQFLKYDEGFVGSGLEFYETVWDEAFKTSKLNLRSSLVSDNKIEINRKCK